MHRWIFLVLVLSACTFPYRAVPHGREPLGGIWYFKASDDPAWAAPGLDETDYASGWRVVDVPGGLREYASRDDTGGWLRVRFIAPPALRAAESVLVLGRADATIDAHLNGVCLGGVPKDAGEPVIRAFNVPRGVLQEANVLAVRVTDWGKPGGIVGGPVALVTAAEWEAAARKPGDGASLHEVEGAHARAAYDPDRHRMVSFGTREKTVLDDAHFVLRTKVREYDLSRIPESEVETLADGRGVRTMHVLAGEGIRFEARYVLPAAVEWQVLAVVGEAKAEDGRAVDVDLVYHPATPGVIGTGALRTTPDGRFTWGRLFVYAPKGDLEILPASVRKYYRPEGAFELVSVIQADPTALPYPYGPSGLQGQTYDKLRRVNPAIDFIETGLSEVLDLLSSQGGWTCRLPPDIRAKAAAKRISFKARNLSTHNVIRVLLSQWNLGYDIDDQGCVNITDSGRGLCYADSRMQALDELDKVRQGELRDDRELEEIENKILASFDQIRVTIEVSDQPLREVVEFLRQFMNCSFVFEAEPDQARTITYSCHNIPLSKALKDILGSEQDYVFDPILHVCSKDAAKTIREKRLQAKTRRDQHLSWPVASRGASLTATLDHLRRFDNLPLVPDREVWEKGKDVTLDADAMPLKDFLDRAAAKLGAKWAYCEGTIYIYMPAQK